MPRDRLGEVRDPQASCSRSAPALEKAARIRIHFMLRPVRTAALFRLLAAARGLGPLITGAALNPKPRHYQPQIPAPQGAERQPTRA